MVTKEKWIFFLNVIFLNAKNLEIFASHQTQSMVSHVFFGNDFI
jgi:hypothetical protein